MAVLKQSFITADDSVDLSDIKAFLTYNGFTINRNNDYYSYELGLILEDWHDENIIFQFDKLFLIDAVIYIDLERSKPLLTNYYFAEICKIGKQIQKFTIFNYI